MATKHAVLSASSSERWLNCPPSARLCEAYEDKGSDYAAEGTDAHALCEFRLKQALGIPADDPIENLSWYNEEMEDCAAGYAAYVSELLETAKQTCADPVILIEQRVDFSRWVQDGFGTADCIVIADGELNIVDYMEGSDKMQTLSIDLETFSSQLLAKTGVYRYAESPDFEITELHIQAKSRWR